MVMTKRPRCSLTLAAQIRARGDPLALGRNRRRSGRVSSRSATVPTKGKETERAPASPRRMEDLPVAEILLRRRKVPGAATFLLDTREADPWPLALAFLGGREGRQGPAEVDGRFLEDLGADLSTPQEPDVDKFGTAA